MATRLLIVGGVAGGASAAARARRVDENAEIIVFERGEYISFANCGLPYYIGGEIEEREDLLVATPELFRDRFNVEIRNFSEVTKVNRDKKEIEVKNLQTGDTYTEKYDKLILSPGAEPIRPPLEGIDLEGIFTLRTIPDTDMIKAWVESNKPKKSVVVGGGFIGLEMAESLVFQGVEVDIVEMLDQVMPPLDYEMALFVHDHLEEKGVGLKLAQAVQKFSKNGNGRLVVSTSKEEIDCDMVILSIGVKPENRLAKEAGLDIGERGGIKTDSTMRTSDPDIFAVGDCVETKNFVTGEPAQVPLAGPANRQGRIAADNALGRQMQYRGTQGTAVVKVFDLTVALTGCNEKYLRSSGRKYMASYNHSYSNASYYPGGELLSLKLLFDPDDGKVLGAQSVRPNGYAKRIDAIATAIAAGMTVYDLEELELAYAPPFGSAKDPVNIAGFVAANILRGDHEIVHWHELADLDPDKYQLLDVRNQEEIDETRLLGNAIHIPVNELRKRLSELDRDKIYVPYCAIGLRGYIAYRMLVQNGFRARNLSGGCRTAMPPCREGI